MTLIPYREALALPGVRSLLLVALLARVPTTAAGVTLTLHVVFDLGRGYGAAGAVGAAMTVGAAVGSPLIGRLVDRRGLRPALLATTLAEAVFWVAAPSLPYLALLVAALFGGLLALPVFSVVRQSVAALVPPERRRPAYALDSMSVELSFMVGPALAVLLATTVSARAAMVAVGAGVVLAGVALLVLDPPIRADDEPAAESRSVPRRQWLTPRLLGLLAVGAASTLVLGGTDVAVVAVLRAADQVGYTGLVLALWAAFSLVGGFVYGMAHRSLSPVLLAGALSLCTIPVGLGGDQWWLLCLALVPAGALCAPTLAATADTVSREVPAAVRGEAMGLHGSAMTVGIALGAPLAGVVIDLAGPAWGFAATGLLGAVVTLAALPLHLRHRRTATSTAGADPGGPGVPGASGVPEVSEVRTPSPDAPATPTAGSAPSR